MRCISVVLISIFTAQAAGSASQIALPELNDDAAPSSLIQGESVATHESVVRTQSLRERLADRMNLLRQKGQSAFMQKSAQGVAMSASSNLLSAPKIESLLQTTADTTLEAAVKQAAHNKESKRVTLEELLVVETNAHDAVDSVSSELSTAFNQMMGKHQACSQCMNDCPALQWRKYDVHTMAQCKENCKLVICKEVSPASYAQQVAEFQDRMKEPHFAQPTQFSSYLEEYNKAHGLQEITVDDDDKFEIVWEQPSEEEHTVEPSMDLVEELRKKDSLSMKQRSSELILKELHQQEEDRTKEASMEKLVTALA